MDHNDTQCFLKRLLSRFLERRSVVLGTTVFYFVWASSMWVREPLWAYHREMFVATFLLMAAIGLVINRVWSNLLAAVLSGQLPFIFLAEFWMLSLNAEIAPFSFQHLQAWMRLTLDMGVDRILWLTLSTVILSYSVVSILRCRTDATPNQNL